MGKKYRAQLQQILKSVMSAPSFEGKEWPQMKLPVKDKKQSQYKKDMNMLKSTLHKFCSILFFSVIAISPAHAKNPDVIGKCIGYLAQVQQNGWPRQMSQTQQNYMNSHRGDIQKIVKIQGEQSGCIKPGQSLERCLSSYPRYDRILFESFNTGVTVYTQARRNSDRVSLAVFEAVCAN